MRGRRPSTGTTHARRAIIVALRRRMAVGALVLTLSLAAMASGSAAFAKTPGLDVLTGGELRAGASFTMILFFAERRCNVEQDMYSPVNGLKVDPFQYDPRREEDACGNPGAVTVLTGTFSGLNLSSKGKATFAGSLKEVGEGQGTKCVAELYKFKGAFSIGQELVIHGTAHYKTDVAESARSCSKSGTFPFEVIVESGAGTVTTALTS